MPQCKAALIREVYGIIQLKEALKNQFVGIQLKFQILTPWFFSISKEYTQ